MASDRAPTAASARRALRALRDDERAAFNQGFFRTRPGEYAEGDRFLGLTVPQVRAVAREHRDLPLEDLADLLNSAWHEDRMLALVVLVERTRRVKDPLRLAALGDFYITHLDRVNHWDLVDLSAPQMLGPYFETRSRAPLRAWARSASLWRRRVAMLTTFHFIRKGEFDDALTVARMLVHDEHDLIHKAVGWMLREIGKRDRALLNAFLDEHAATMPRTMLRYAIEKLPQSEKAHRMRAAQGISQRPNSSSPRT